MRWSERKFRSCCFPVYAILFLCSGTALGEESAEEGGIATSDNFFSEIDAQIAETPDAEGPDAKRRDEADPWNWNLSGFLKQDINYAVQPQNEEFPFSRSEKGFRSMRTTGNISLKGKLFSRASFEISGNVFYDWFYHHSGDADDVSDAEYAMMADDAELREVFVNFELVNDFWLKIGQQIIAWGESDYIQILDVANPRDEREFGLVDLEDARIPIEATRLSYVGDRWGADIALLHEFEPNRWMGDFSDFDPLIQIRGAVGVEGETRPDVDLEDPDAVARVFLSFSGGDVSLVYGEVHDHTPSMRPVNSEESQVALFYQKVKSVGIAANWVAGFLLFKTEVAQKSDVLFARDDWPMQFAAESDPLAFYNKGSIYQALLGVEYAGFQDVQLSIEGFTDRIADYSDILSREQQESQTSARVNFEFLRDTLSLELLWAHWIDTDSDTWRMAVRYDWTDEIKLSLGYIDYAASQPDATLYAYQNGDRLFASFKYSF